MDGWWHHYLFSYQIPCISLDRTTSKCDPKFISIE